MSAEAKIREALAAGPTPGPWLLATSNSWRRIVSMHHGMTSVCEPITQNDGHPDLYFRNGGSNGPDAQLLAACNPTAMTELLAEFDRLRAEVEGLRASVLEEAAWIGIDERRPELDEPVLVFNPDGPLHISIDEWCIYREAPVSWSSATIETGEGWANHEFEQITHWMPLPDGPDAIRALSGPKGQGSGDA